MEFVSCAAGRRVVVSYFRDFLFRCLLTFRRLARPALALKFVLTLGVVGSLASLRANALVNPTASVGATSGSFAVSASGAATYTIPIAVPPGTHGIQPSLSLAYDSHAGNGWVGMGWMLAGLSVIHRCGATVELDGFKGGVNYDVNDRFCLDGERLIKIGTTEYRTERESLQRVIASDGTTNPATFIVIEKDGATREYAVAIEAAGNSAIRRLWALSKVRDVHGNYLTVAYDKSDVAGFGDYRPTSISYTANDAAGISATNSVVFSYANRSDLVPLYEAGYVIEGLKLLASITSYAGTTKVRDYRLAYDNNGAAGRPRLASVQECGSDGVCVPPTLFGWSQEGGQLEGDAIRGMRTQAYNTNSGGFQLEDMNGDGLLDLVYDADISTSWGCGASGSCTLSTTVHSIRVLLNTGSGFGPDTEWGQRVYGYNDNGKGFRLIDMNGDGLPDLLYNGGDNGNNNLHVLLNTGSAFGPDILWGTKTSSYINSAKGYRVADINGDGLPDFIYDDNSGNRQLHVLLNNGSALGADVVWGNRAASYSDAGGGLQVIDVNGDGLPDVVYSGTDNGNDNIHVLLNTGTAFGSDTVWGVKTVGFNDNGGGIQLVDLNGDGLPDLFYSGADNSDKNVHVLLNTGTTFGPDTLWGVRSAALNVNAGVPQLADMNGDGLPDLVYNSGTNDIHVLLNTGTAFSADTIWGAKTAAYNINAGGPKIVDVNGDGLPDFVYNSATFDIHVLAKTVTDTHSPTPNQLVSVTNGFGAVTSTYYKAISADANIYTDEVSARTPYVDLHAGLLVVSSVSTSDGVGGVNTSTYRYGGLKRHVTANVSLGFEWVQTIDPSGLVNVTYYNQNREAGIDGTVAANQLFAPSGNVLLKSTANTWVQSVGAICGGTREPQLAASVEETHEFDGSVVTKINTSTSYDSCGFPTSVVTDFNDGWRKTVNNLYAPPDTANWILGLITQTQVVAEGPGLAAKTRSSSFTYTSEGPLASETIEPGTALAITTSYGYDGFGNRTTKTVSGADIATHTVETVAYDASGRFAVSRMNALGYQVTYRYDARGLPVSQTDPNGLMTKWDYDGFGRKIKEVRPDGIQTTITYGATSSGYSIYTQTPGAASLYTFYDILGREVRSATEAFGDNVWIYRDKRYDALGRLAEVSNPDFSSAPSYYTRYNYDLLGRVTAVVTPTTSGTGNTTTTIYNGLITTVTNPLGQQTIEVKNSQGKATSVTDAAGGVTQYSYDVFGNLVTITDALGNVTTLSYDARGRKIAMHDPDMGDWVYGYDVLGQLKRQRDAKNQTITMAYDNLGRMIARTGPEGTSAWTYDSAAYGKGKLASVTGPNGYQETYAYDSLSRGAQVSTTIGGQTYTIRKQLRHVRSSPRHDLSRDRCTGQREWQRRLHRTADLHRRWLSVPACARQTRRNAESALASEQRRCVRPHDAGNLR